MASGLGRVAQFTDRLREDPDRNRLHVGTAGTAGPRNVLARVDFFNDLNATLRLKRCVPDQKEDGERQNVPRTRRTRRTDGRAVGFLTAARAMS